MNARNTARLAAAAGMALLGIAAGLALGRTRRFAARAAMSLTGDWDKQMKAEHRALKKLAKAMAETGADEAARRSALVEGFGDVLARHALEEENIVYPALQAAGLDSAVKAQLDDHAHMRMLLRELEGMSPEDPAFAEAAKRLKKLVYRHARKEEQSLFPMLRDGALDGETEQLTQLVRREAMRMG